MLKFFYRLKKRGGVVLFAVVAIMTVLIVMASVAYFTARSSYQTVVSNYDFSQTYISTTSVADMVLSAVAFDSYKDKASGNYYDGLRGLLKGVEAKVEADILAKNQELIKDYNNHHSDAKIEDNAISPFYIKTIDYGEYGTKDRKKSFIYTESGTEKPAEDTLEDSDIEALVVSGSTINIKDKIGDAVIEASMDDPVKGGILDACEVKITLDWAKVMPVDNPESEKDKYSSLRYYYTFTTTGYYRGNSISVSDTVYHDATKGSNTGLPQFDTFFTCSSQELTSTGDKSYDTGRTVVINTKLVSDNAYFQNENTVMTCISGTSAFDFLGGVKTKGNLYITSDMTGNLPKPEGDRRHDWIIGGDLFINRNANVNFNGNCLYVKGDLYLGTSSGAFHNLGACFVEGNIYILDASRTYFDLCNYDSLGIKNEVDSDGNITKLHRVVPQGIHIGKGVYVVDKNTSNSAATTAQVNAYINNINNEMNNTLHKSDMFKDTYALDIGTWSDHYNGTDWNVFGSCPLYYNSDITKDIGPHRTLKSATDIFDDSAAASFSKIVKEGKGEGSKYTFEMEEQTVSKILSDTSNLTGYDVYSAKDTAQSAILEIDLSSYNTDDKHKGTEQPVGSVVSSVDGKTYEATLIYGNGKNELTLPFVPGGYTLKFKTGEVYDYYHKLPDGNYGQGYIDRVLLPDGFAFNAMSRWCVNICTGSYKDPSDSTKTIRTMPIVLTANFNDGNESDANGTRPDENGLNAFSWKFGDMNNDCEVVVRLYNEDCTDSAKDFVIFEMGNYIKSNEKNPDGSYKNGGPYEQYDKNKVDSLETVVYYCSNKQFVGTANQFSVLGAQSITDASKFDPFYADKATGQLKDTYANKLMIVSAKNHGRMAVCTGDINSTTTCGYIYAPNGNFTANAQNDAYAVFGGMIVSDYTLNHDNFLYAMPDPLLIEGLETGFDDITGEKTVASTVWHIEGDGTGKNYLG